MTASDFNMLWRAIDVLEAQEHIAESRAATYPHLTKKARVERDQKMTKAAYPRTIYKKDTKEVSYLLNKLGGASG